MSGYTVVLIDSCDEPEAGDFVHIESFGSFHELTQSRDDWARRMTDAAHEIERREEARNAPRPTGPAIVRRFGGYVAGAEFSDGTVRLPVEGAVYETPEQAAQDLARIGPETTWLPAEQSTDHDNERGPAR